MEGSELFILQEISKIYKQLNIKSILLSIDIEKVPSLIKYKDDLQKLIRHFPVQITIREDKEIDLALSKWLLISGLRKNNGRFLLRDLFRGYLPYSRNMLRIIKPLSLKKFGY